MKSHPRVVVLPLFLTLAIALACSPKQKETGPLDVSKTVAEIASGALIQKMNAAKEAEPEPVPSAALPEVSELTQSKELPPAPVQDPCQGKVGALPAESTIEERAALLAQFGQCMRELYRDTAFADMAFDHFIALKRGSDERALSAMTDAELEAFLKDGANHPTFADMAGMSGAPHASRMRASFSDDDLVELLALVARRKEAYSRAEARIFAAVDAHRALLEEAVTSELNRYELLLALRDTATDPDGKDSCARVAKVLSQSGMAVPEEIESFPCQMLHPFGLVAVIPEKGSETAALEPGENPFRMVEQALAQLSGPKEMIDEIVSLYKFLRTLDNPPAPEHADAHPEAVKVSFIDTGVDFINYPELGLFLGSGSDIGLRSYDLADGDLNPWLPSSGSFGHGSGTMASLLTIVAHQHPEILKERRLELAMWKVRSIRSLLAGGVNDGSHFTNRYEIAQAMLHRKNDPIRPKIVSASMGFTLKKLLELSKETDAVRKAPWLWIMAAGNSGVEVAKSPMPSCFSDLDPSQVNRSRVLCVGALSKGIIDDRIAGYSNYGHLVDVYAYDSYIGMCPDGTSCATPAVSGAAAVIAAKFPKLKPEHLKQIIVSASELKTLEVDAPPAVPGLPREKRTIRVFDPATMLPKALEMASKLSAELKSRK